MSQGGNNPGTNEHMAKQRLLDVAKIIEERGWSQKTNQFIADKYGVTTRCVRMWVKTLTEELYGKGSADEQIDWKTRKLVFLDKLQLRIEEAFQKERTFTAGIAGMNLWAKVEGFDREDTDDQPATSTAAFIDTARDVLAKLGNVGRKGKESESNS